MNNPTDPKVVAASAGAGVASALVVLLLNLINKEPLNQQALELVLTAVITAVITYAVGWLKRTPAALVGERFEAMRRFEADPARHKEAGHVDVQTVLVMFAVAIVTLAIFVLLFRM